MKKLLLLFACLFTFLSANAQPVEEAPIAYVNSDRTQILSVRRGGTPKIILQSKGVGTLQEIRTSHLAVLASTRDGKSLLVAGVFHFFNLNDDSKDSIQGFLRLDSPYAFVGRASLDKKTLGGQKVLHSIPFVLEEPGYIEVRKPLPIGTLSPNEQDWFAHWCKNGATNPNYFEFYHGKFNGTGTVDVGTLPDNDERLPEHEYHMTNICADEQGRMISVVMDRLTQEEDLLRARLWRWTPGQTPQLTDMNAIRTLRPFWHMDSSFVCLLRIVPGQSNPTAEIGLMPNDEGNIIFYEFRYDGASVNLGSGNGRTIPRSVIPDSIFFFTGKTEDPLGPNDGGRETQSVNQRHVNGGDMMFSQTGDSVVFIVSNALTPNGSSDWYASPERSGIWIYDIAAGWPEAKLVYNDKTKMERQPIFMGYIPKIVVPPPPGTITVDKVLLDYDTVNIKDSTKTLGVKISNLSANPASVTSFEITGANELEFFNMGTVPPVTTPFTLNTNESVVLNIKFDPSAVGIRTATLTIRFADADSSRTVSLRGEGVKTADGAVSPEDMGAFSVNVHPNPFNGFANIDINYDGREGLDVRLVDILGREYDLVRDGGVQYRNIRKDAFDQFKIDRRQMNLVPGSYTLFVKNGERLISRQLILTNE